MVRSLAAGLAAMLALSAATLAKPVQAASSRMVFAVIGDYGICQTNCVNEQAVANMVHAWGADAILTVGDNSYENGGNPPSTAAQVPADQKPYAADVAAGRFYEVAGNHDWGTGNIHSLAPSTAYFGRPAHYVAHFGGGLLDFFATDMNYEDPDGDGPGSAQAAQYRTDVATSTAIWKIAATHQPFFSSGQHGTQAYTHWAILPAIDLFLSGHDHDFEHLVEGGKNYVVDGVGGRNLYPICVPGCLPTSVWHDGAHFGAVRLTVTPGSLQVEFVAVGGVVEHAFSLTGHSASSGVPPAGGTTTSKPAATPSTRARAQPTAPVVAQASAATGDATGSVRTVNPMPTTAAEPRPVVAHAPDETLVRGLMVGLPLLVLVVVSIALRRRLRQA